MATGSKWTDLGQSFAIDALNNATRGGLGATYTGAWGSGATTPAVTDVALVSENPETRVTCTESQPSSNTIRFVYVMVATAARTVQETSVNVAAGANAFIRIVHGSLSLDVAGDQVTYTIDLALKDSSE